MCALTTKEGVLVEDNLGKPLTHSSSKIGLSYDDMLNDNFSFDMDSHDVIVFLHMQKTGKLNRYFMSNFTKITLL